MTNGKIIQAPSVLIYGLSGLGKSTLVLNALTPERTLWISAERGALRPASSPDLNRHYPRRPQELVCLTVARVGAKDAENWRVAGEMSDAIDHASELVRKGTVWNVVIDTLSSYARRLDHFVREVRGFDRAYGKATDRIAQEVLPYIDRLHETVATVRRPNGVMGACLVVICHEKDPFQAAADKRTGEAAKRLGGGPDVPGYLTKKIRHDFDLVIRMDLRAVGPAGTVQRVFAHDSLDKDYPTKDKWALMPDRARGDTGLMPADLGVLLRAGTARDFGRDPAAADMEVIRRFAEPARGPREEELATL